MTFPIKNIRETLGVNQTEMAKLVGINRVRYLRYENNKRRIPSEIAYELIDIAKDKGIEIKLEDIYPRNLDCKP
jgi:DNA-binding XRE family transcriptional regulator